MAHGRPLMTTGAFVSPDADGPIYIATPAALLREDEGEWRWACREGTARTATENARILIRQDGSLLSGVFRGLDQGTADACDWSLYDQAPVQGEVIIDVVRHPAVPNRLYALTSSGFRPNELLRSEDDGGTWEPTSEPIGTHLFERIVLAPSNPDILYVTGVTPATVETPRSPIFFFSEDGGTTWEQRDFEFEEGDTNLFVLGVDPSDSQRIYLRTRGDQSTSAPFDRLVVSEDGGETFEMLLRVRSLDGFVFDDDGNAFVAAGWPPDDITERERGLWTIPAGGTLTQVNDEISAGCLTFARGALYLCGDEVRDGFSLARSTDGGESFEPIMKITDLAGPISCGPETSVGTDCDFGNEDIVRDIGLQFGTDAGVSTDGGTRDAGATDASMDGGMEGSGEGCECRADASFSRSFGWFLVLLALMRKRQR